MLSVDFVVLCWALLDAEGLIDVFLCRLCMFSNCFSFECVCVCAQLYVLKLLFSFGVLAL